MEVGVLERMMKSKVSDGRTSRSGGRIIAPSFLSTRPFGATQIAPLSGGRIIAPLLPIAQNHQRTKGGTVRLEKLVNSLRQRTDSLAVANRLLKEEVVRRKIGEESLRKSAQKYSLLLAQSRRMQEELRYLAHELLSAQEEERKEISRELHDEVAQTLAGINVQLATLKIEATINTRGVKKKIANAQRLVEKSVDIVHRFARRLRPALLDDLGLIPALHSYLKGFAQRTGLRVHFTAFAGVEELNSAKRTVFYRVAQAALTNVANHAKASEVKVSIRKRGHAIGTAWHEGARRNGRRRFFHLFHTRQRHHHLHRDSF
jgi:signal transduction histidine kinase